VCLEAERPTLLSCATVSLVATSEKEFFARENHWHLPRVGDSKTVSHDPSRWGYYWCRHWRAVWLGSIASWIHCLYTLRLNVFWPCMTVIRA